MKSCKYLSAEELPMILNVQEVYEMFFLELTSGLRRGERISTQCRDIDV